MAFRILAVDDEPMILKGLRFSLEQDGYEVDEALDGEAALTGRQLGAWQGTTDDGHGFITLARADTPEGGAVVALLWGKRWAFA